MAIINNSNKFIFIHVPKAAGTSITSELSAFTQYCDIEVGGTAFGEKIQNMYKTRFNLYKHITSAELQHIVGSDVWDSYFKFSIVRNPYTRLFSIFSFLKAWEGTNSDLKAILFSFENFNSFVESEIWTRRPGPDDIFYPQCNWVSGSGEYRLDFVGKVENIDADFIRIVNRIDQSKILKSKSVKVLNNSSRNSENGLSERSLKLINNFYEVDFTEFSYDMIHK